MPRTRKTRKDGRVVECTGFEIRRTGLPVPRVRIPLFPPSNSMNTPLTRRFCFVSTLLPTGLFPAGYADSVDLELDLIGKEGCIGMES